MSLCSYDDNKELIKLSPILLYEIAMDIQVTDKWKPFANLIGFTTEQILMLQINSGDRFPAENVLYHWFSKNPRTGHLAEHLCTLLLEKPLTRLNGNLDPATYKRLMNRLQNNRHEHSKPLIKENNSDCCLESLSNFAKDEEFMKPIIQPQLSNASVSSTTDSGTPEPGIVNISLHDPSIPRSSLIVDFESDTNDKENIGSEKTANHDSIYTLISKMLKKKSTEFYANEFIDIESFEGSLQGLFSSNFNTKLRANQFNVRTFCFSKILQSTKDKKKLYNIIWSLQNFKLNHFPILNGFCFYQNYLFLLFPFQKWYSLYDILHRPHDAENKTISATERLSIVRDIGEALAFLHLSLPFGGYHGQVNSYNVMVSNTNVILSGFDKFCTQRPDYLKGLEIIKKVNIDPEECFRKDKLQFLELICETWWNVQPSNVGENYIESCLIKDIAGDIIINPKVIYDGWSYEYNEEIRGLIKRFCEDKKGSGSIAEIVEDIKESIHEPYQRLQPPSYVESLELYSELKDFKKDLSKP